MPRSKKKKISPLVEKKPSSSLKIQGASDAVYYTDVCKNLELDYAAYSKAIADIDSQIEELQGLKALIVTENKKMVVFYEASRQFNIKDLILNGILNISEYKQTDKIFSEVLKTLNMHTMSREMSNKIGVILADACNENTYKESVRVQKGSRV